MPTPPTDISAGQIITADWLNQVKNAAVYDVRVGPGLSSHLNAGRLAIGLSNRRAAIPFPQDLILGRVTATEGIYKTTLTVEEVFYDRYVGYTTLTGGRLWDGTSGNFPKVIAIDGRPRDVGDYVTVAQRMGPNEGVQWYVSPEKFFFAVVVTKDGGIDGVYNTTKPTYTYTVKDWSTGSVLALAKSPFNNRDFAEYTAATKGWAWIDNNGDLQLGFVNEEIILPASVGDNVGYWQIEANSPFGNGVTASELAAGKIEFKSRANAGEIPIYTEITNGAGTDDVLQYIKESDLPSGGADGQGFESITDGTTTLNKTDGGIIAFSTATPSADELAVEFTVADNDPTATVTGVVDVSGITGDGGTLAGAIIIDKHIRVAETVTTTYTQVIYDGNCSGRTIVFYGESLEDDDGTNWASGGAVTSAFMDSAYIGTAHAGDVTLNGGSKHLFYIDASDSYKLKLDITGAPSGGTFHFFRFGAIIQPRKTAYDIDIS